VRYSFTHPGLSCTPFSAAHSVISVCRAPRLSLPSPNRASYSGRGTMAHVHVDNATISLERRLVFMAVGATFILPHAHGNMCVCKFDGVCMHALVCTLACTCRRQLDAHSRLLALTKLFFVCKHVCICTTKFRSHAGYLVRVHVCVLCFCFVLCDVCDRHVPLFVTLLQKTFLLWLLLSYLAGSRSLCDFTHASLSRHCACFRSVTSYRVIWDIETTFLNQPACF